MKIKEGLIKRIHVDRHVLARNKKHNENERAITVQTSKGPLKGHRVIIYGTSDVIQNEEQPLSCGARVWVETKSEVEVL
jgi:hypothetical protein